MLIDITDIAFTEDVENRFEIESLFWVLFLTYITVQCDKHQASGETEAGSGASFAHVTPIRNSTILFNRDVF